MEQVISNFANIAAGVVGVVVQSIPEPDTLPYFIMLATLLVLLALLCVWLLIRLRRARLAKAADAAFSPEITFDDISAEAAAAQPRRLAEPEIEPEIEPEPVLVPHAAHQEMAAHSAIAGSEGATGEAGTPSDGERGEAPAGSFRFFKRKPKVDADGASSQSVEDDVFLLGLEREMLATRQLYLDGLITKEVYVTETRALFDKAQSRMT